MVKFTIYLIVNYTFFQFCAVANEFNFNIAFW